MNFGPLTICRIAFSFEFPSVNVQPEGTSIAHPRLSDVMSLTPVNGLRDKLVSP